MDNLKKILAELRAEFNFDESSNFIEDGYLDSFDIVSLIATIEEQYGVSIDGMDIIPENFVSYDSILALIEKSK